MIDTKPDHYKVSGADFIKFMDDPQIKGFGNWMFANGFNMGELSVNRWISVKDRMPRLRQWVLCKCRAGIYEVLRYEETCDGEQWHHDNRHNYMSGFVTHWMPIPDLPQEKMI